MELNQIKQFRVIARTESISKAAEQLYIAQPSLSQTLKRLETELGTPLFERRGKRIVLNGAGKIFLKHCDRIVTSLENAVREISDYVGNTKNDINICFESASLIILDIAEKMRKFYPRSLPHIYENGCGDWDIKLCSGFCPDSSETANVVIEEPIGIVFSKENTLALKKTINRKDLEKCNFLSLNPTDGLTETISHYCAEYAFRPNITMCVESPTIMRELLERGFGIAFVPAYTWFDIYNSSLEFRLIGDMPMINFVNIVMNDKKYISKEIQQCYNALSVFYREFGESFNNVQK